MDTKTLGELDSSQDGQSNLDADGTATPPKLERPMDLSLRAMRQAAEREAITRALRKSQGQVPAAAAMLGISRAQLYRLISRLRLDHHAVADADERTQAVAATATNVVRLGQARNAAS
jgi:DNA-binding NtrC family response regulator